MNRLERFFKSPYLAGFLLLAAYAMAMFGVSHKSVTFDEIGHLAGGYGIWLKDDYRLVPDNGNLSQRWAALPSLWRNDRFPSTNQDEWHVSNVYNIADQLFFQVGNDADSLLYSGRAMMALLIVATGAIVYVWSRSLFGAVGAVVSVALFAFCPTILAHGPLVASDMMVSFFFLAAMGALWRVLHRVDGWNVALSAVALAGLFLSKISGVLIIPMGLMLLLVRLRNPEPLAVQGMEKHPVRRMSAKLLIFGGVILAQVIVVWLLIWAAFGFRYSAFATGTYGIDRLFPGGWEYALAKPGFVSDVVSWLRIGQWFPESYLFGAAMVSRMSGARQSFLNGEFSIVGFKNFFPYAFSVKETIPFLIVLGLAVAAFIWAIRQKSSAEARAYFWGRLYATAPLSILIFFYGAFSLTSNLNIGHRHLLPLYAPIFILAGAAGAWFTQRTRWVGAAVAVLLTWHVVESVAVSPNYLTYFNEFAGGPANGYRHLVDSSLDWGQDLPALKDWLREKGYEDGKTPVYLLYFGMARPEYYKIQATQLPGFTDRVPIGPVPPLLPGLYAVSVTHLQGVYLYCYGPWSSRYEQAYQAQSAIMKEIQAAQKNPEAMRQLETRYSAQGLQKLLVEFPRLRVARLCAWLRTQDRKPLADINHSIFVYQLSAEDLRAALSGPISLVEPAEVVLQ
ncbi:MAG: hypothetical protein B9S32_02365 [Verrucomicrobia bacterium Tous-C9LFEB]|nr:MAG: hypothetical protein B9S32_02365 [Verrucomicrobia bacterium Tous-C9LFEB]